MTNRQKILFLCTGNSARSQIAEAFVRHYGGDRFEAHSAGLEPKGINPYTIRVMEEIGISMDEQTSKSIKQYMGWGFIDYIVTVCAHAEANCPTTAFNFGTKYHWPVEDPAAFTGSEAETLAKFREVREQIKMQIKAWLAEVAEHPA
ncbi:MAG: arsenate reductase ArsC [Anaerolineae bacterium]|nr:arsenate reductase ArsC [Anaerolineae bacterium]